MFVPVIAYEPDLFADFVLVPSMIEISPSSQPVAIHRPTNQMGSGAQQLSTLTALTYMRPTWSWTAPQNLTDDTTVDIVPLPSTQILASLRTQKFVPSSAPVLHTVLNLSGHFHTEQSIEALYDNVVLQAHVTDFILSDTDAQNLPVAPAVSG